jgi:adenylate cyclase
MSAPPRNLAVLFADVSGSTKLYEKLGDVEALAVIERCLKVVKDVCGHYGGRIVKTIGDEAMAVFPDADAAAGAACEMQLQIATRGAAGRVPVAIHVGIHVGEVIEDGGDVFGDSVNVAARMTSLANAAQIITSAASVAMLSARLRERIREHDAFTVQGKQKDMTLFELIWQESEDELTAMSTRMVVAPARLRLTHAGREFQLDASHQVLTLGRDAQNDLVIGDRKASRMHARLERRRDKFILIDQSSNGTFLTLEGSEEIALRREEFTLRGRGRVSFGHAYVDDPSEVLVFSCVD